MRILLAIDGAPCSAAAVSAAAKYCSSPANQLQVLHVVDWPGSLPYSFGFTEGRHAGQAVLEARDRMIGEGQALVTRVANSLRRDGFEPATSVVVGDVAETILQGAAGWRADLVILGTHGRGGLDRLVMGSVAEAVLRQAKCPVEIVGPAASAVSDCSESIAR
jgi:nucleotide-binding universal stress UspA family protein